MSEPCLGSAEDRALWRRVTEDSSFPEPEPELLLDLAAFAEGRLEGEALAALLAQFESNPELAEDAAYAASLSEDAAYAASQTEKTAQIIAFPSRIRTRRLFSPVMGWGALVASLVLVSYLGFDLGNSAYASLAALVNPGIAAEQDFIDQPSDMVALAEMGAS